ncbi:hypothetical protein Tco_0111648, partial [Tanacetum coccineum]
MFLLDYNYTVISDSDESGVTHTEISSPFEDLSDIGSPGVVGPEHEGLPWMLDDPYVKVTLQAPPSPDYIPGLEEPQSPPLPDFVPEPVYPEYMPQEDEVFPAKEQPLPATASATTQSPDYVPESDPEADLGYRVTARISIPAPVPTPVWSDAEVARLLAISTPSSSPLFPWSSPLPQIPSPPLPPIPSPSLPVLPPLPVSSPMPVLSPSPPASLIRPLGYRAAIIWLRAKAASTSHLLPLPPPIILSHTRPAAPSSGIPPFHLLSIDRREDRPEVPLPPQKRLGIPLGPTYEVRESSSATDAISAGGLRADYGFVATMDREIMRDLERDVGYGITDSWDEIVETLQGAPDTNGIYMRLDDEQSGRQLLAGRINMLFRDRGAHAQVMSLRTTMLAQQSQIRELQSADRRRQTVITEMLTTDHRRQK